MTSLPSFISATPDPAYAPGIPASPSLQTPPADQSADSQTSTPFAGLLEGCAVTASPTPATPATGEIPSALFPLASTAQWLRIETSPVPVTTGVFALSDTFSTESPPAGSQPENIPGPASSPPASLITPSLPTARLLSATPPPAPFSPVNLPSTPSLTPQWPEAATPRPAESPTPLVIEADPAPRLVTTTENQTAPALQTPPEIAMLGLLPFDYRIQNTNTNDRDTEASLPGTQPQTRQSVDAPRDAAPPLSTEVGPPPPPASAPLDRPAVPAIATPNQTPMPGQPIAGDLTPAQTANRTPDQTTAYGAKNTTATGTSKPAAKNPPSVGDSTPPPPARLATTDHPILTQDPTSTATIGPKAIDEKTPALSLEKIAASLRTLSNQPEKPADSLSKTPSDFSTGLADKRATSPAGITTQATLVGLTPETPRIALPSIGQTSPEPESSPSVALSGFFPQTTRIFNLTTQLPGGLEHAEPAPVDTALPAQTTAKAQFQPSANYQPSLPLPSTPDRPSPVDLATSEQVPMLGQQNSAGGMPPRSPGLATDYTPTAGAPKPASPDTTLTDESAPAPQLQVAGPERQTLTQTVASTTTANPKVPQENAPAFASEKIAASLRTLPNQPVIQADKPSKNKFLTTDKQADVKSKTHHGIVNAKTMVEMTSPAPIDPAQPAPVSGREAVLSTPSREMPARSIMELAQSSAAPQTPASSSSSPAPTPDATLRREIALPSTDPVAVVREVAELTHDFRFHERNSVEVKFNFKDNTELSVRIAYRDGDVQATFLTESPELRATLSREWQAYIAQAQQEPRSFRVADPVFSNSGDLSGNAQGRDSGSSGGGDSRQQPSSSHSDQSGTQRQAQTSFGFGANTSAKSAPASGPAPRVSTERLLHAFA